MTVEQKKDKRSFGGKTSDFKDKAEQALEQKHLKAYLKGYKVFRHGSMYHKVKEIWS